MYLKISSNLYNLNIPLERRITFLRGDSGVGKTTLVDMIIASFNGGGDILIDCPMSVEVPSITDSLESLKSKKNCLLVYDDSIKTETTEFISCLQKYLVPNNLYLLIINRADWFSKDNVSLDYAVKSILYLKKDGTSHYINTIDDMCNLVDITTSTKLKNSIMLTEDKYGLYSFCKEYSNIDVISSEGKYKILLELKKLFKSNKIILLYPDMACFGKYAGDIISIEKLNNITIVWDLDYECFEYLILKSNIYNFSFNVDEANQYYSWEKFFEFELERLSKNLRIKGLHYIHGNDLPYCYKNTYMICKKPDCSMRNNWCSVNKLKSLLKGTIFEYLLNLLKVGE